MNPLNMTCKSGVDQDEVEDCQNQRVSEIGNEKDDALTFEQNILSYNNQVGGQKKDFNWRFACSLTIRTRCLIGEDMLLVLEAEAFVVLA